MGIIKKYKPKQVNIVKLKKFLAKIEKVKNGK
jgi:hypothetical protein